MKVVLKTPIRVRVDRSQFEEDDGELYLNLKPSTYEFHELEEYDVDGDRIDIKVPLVASFWTPMDVDPKHFEIREE